MLQHIYLSIYRFCSHGVLVVVVLVVVVQLQLQLQLLHGVSVHLKGCQRPLAWTSAPAPTFKHCLIAAPASSGGGGALQNHTVPDAACAEEQYVD